tara:strand:- start:48 stop:269 length:222 start_codon:yes stop_codon:yes gene_type:complete
MTHLEICGVGREDGKSGEADFEKEVGDTEERERIELLKEKSSEVGEQQRAQQILFLGRLCVGLLNASMGVKEV